jgi:DNA-binding transcriptional LysR family regulator
MLDWNQLRILLAIARQHSLSGAARELSVEHSTVGRQLEKLEKTLDTRLFDRTPEGFVLTPAGESVLAHARSIEEETLALEREVAGHDARVTGTVRLSALDACITDFILPAMPNLAAQHPGLEMIVTSEMRLVDLSRREADIAIRYERPSAPNLVVRKLAETRSALYASKAYIRKHGLLESATAFAGHKLIGLAPAYSIATEEQYLRKHADSRDVVVRVDSQLTLREAIRTGLGIGILECYLGDADSKLVRVWQEPIFSDPWWLVVHKDLRYAARIRAVMDFLNELAETQRDRLEGKR